VAIGMGVVQAVAQRWGTERLNGQRVWAVLTM
jgi:hypothetical protein